MCSGVTDPISNYVSAENTLRELGGLHGHSQQQWIEFFGILEPLQRQCIATGKKLVTVMGDIRNADIQVREQPISHMMTIMLPGWLVCGTRMFVYVYMISKSTTSCCLECYIIQTMSPGWRPSHIPPHAIVIKRIFPVALFALSEPVAVSVCYCSGPIKRKYFIISLINT